MPQTATAQKTQAGQKRQGPIVDPTVAPPAPQATQGPTVASVTPYQGTTTLVPTDLAKPRVVVMRALQGPRMFDPHEVIEVPDFQRRKALRTSRRIRELEHGEELYACTCGRLWAGQEPAARHACAS